MQATESEVEALLGVQERDMELMRLEARLSGLEEVAQISECRARRRELKGKQDQVTELADGVAAKLERLQEEERALSEKVAELQKKLDGTGDHRVVGSITKEMEGQTKRQGENAKEQDALLERQIEAERLDAQLSQMLARVDEREAALTESFREKGGAIKERVQAAQAARAELAAQVNAAAMARYEQLRKEKGGIGLATVEDGHCSACRTALQTGQMARLRTASGLAECPNCHRLMACPGAGQ
jgi:uncharacterized protein